MNVYLPPSALDLVVAELGKSCQGIKTIARMREVSKDLKQRIDHLVVSNAIFIGCFNNQPRALCAFILQKEPKKLLHEIAFRIYGMIPRERFEIEKNVTAKRKLIESFGVFFQKHHVNLISKNEEFNSLLNQVRTPYDLLEHSLQEGCTALHYACYHEGSISDIQQLLDKGADINQPSIIGSTAICFAIQKGRRDVVEFLKEKGANLNCPEWADMPTLFWIESLIKDNPKEVIAMLQLLQKFHMDLKIQNRKGNTLLHLAALNKSAELITELVKTYHIPMDIRNKNGDLAMAFSKDRKTLRQFYILGGRIDENDRLSIVVGSAKLGSPKGDIFQKIPHAIKEVRFKNRFQKEDVQSLLYFPYIQKLTFEGRGLTDKLLMPLAELNKLSTLYITNISILIEGSFFQNHDNLTDLSISGDGSIHSNMFQNLSRLKKLRTLTVSDLFCQKQDDWLYFSVMKSLEELQLNNTSITKDQLCYLPPNLKKIFFWRNRHLSDVCISAIIGLKNLQSLSIIDCLEVTIEGVKTILKFMPQVKLYIRCSRLKQEELDKLHLEYPNRLD